MATTKYRVLRKRPGPVAPTVSGTAGAPGAPGAASPSEAAASETFEVLYRNVEAGSSTQALRLALADVNEASGTYVAVPERNWSEITVRSEPQPNRLVIGEIPEAH